jgi:hypothetical protein
MAIDTRASGNIRSDMATELIHLRMVICIKVNTSMEQLRVMGSINGQMGILTQGISKMDRNKELVSGKSWEKMTINIRVITLTI